MGWTSPRTWVAGEKPTAAIMNTHVRDNLEALKSPPSAYVLYANAASTTTSAWLDIPGTSVSVTTTGGALMITAYVYVFSGSAYFDVNIDGTGYAAGRGWTSGWATVYGSNGAVGAHITVLETPLAAGAHTVKLQWYSVGGSTVSGVRVVLWVREV